MSLELPITPGKYRTRDGRDAVVRHVTCECWGYPVKGTVGIYRESWALDGRRYDDGKESGFDLVSRIDDAPNPLIAPMEWALGQLDESLDPEWQAAYKAATEALAKAKGGAA